MAPPRKEMKQGGQLHCPGEIHQAIAAPMTLRERTSEEVISLAPLSQRAH